MIHLEITSEQRKKAKQHFAKTLENSITKGGGNMAGSLGEIMVLDWYGGYHVNTYDFDVVIKGMTIDVKTKRFKSGLTPTEDWTLNIAAYNTKQQCNYYCFAGVSDDYTEGYVYGFIKKNQFYEQAVFNKKGEQDKQNPWVYKADCYNITIKDLKQNE